MMKRVLITFVVLALIGGGVWYVMQPTRVTVKAVLAGTNVDVTGHIFFQLGPLREGVNGAADQTKIQPITGRFEAPNEYEVPSNTPLYVFGHSRTLSTTTDTVSVRRGKHETLVVEVDAGLVEANLLSDDEAWMGQRRLYLQEMFGEVGPEFPEDGTMTLLLQPGQHRLIANHGLVQDQKDIVVATGQVQSLGFDTRIGDVKIAIDTPLPWSASLPEIIVAIKGMDGNWGGRLNEMSEWSVNGIRYGTYDIVINFDYGSRSHTNIHDMHAGQIIVDQRALSKGVSLDVMALQIDLTELDEAEMEDAEVLLFPTSGGFAHAKAEIVDGLAQIVFLPAANDPSDMTYVVAVRKGDEVFALTDIGRPETGGVADVVLQRGGDAALCAAIFPAGYCDELNP